MKAIVYHNPRCSKSRQTVQLLKDKGIDTEIVEYLKTPLTEQQLRDVVRKLGISATQLVRTKDRLYKELYAGQQLTDEDAIRLLAEHPQLMERPIVVYGKKAALGRPPENVLKLFS